MTRQTWINCCMMVFGLCLSCTEVSVHPDFKMKNLQMGQGEKVGRFDTVVVHYQGRFEDGRLFDESGAKGKRYSMRSATLIDGWKVGLLGMQVGGKRRLWVPPEMAFGKKGKFGRIPPDATLIFDIELLEIK